MMLWIPLVSLLGAAVADGQSKGAMSWDAAVSAAQKLAAKMTTAEMNSIVYGTGQTVGLGTTSAGCAGSLNALDRLGIPRLCFQDGSHGVHGAELVNGYAAGYSVGASWNTDLAYQRGLYMGAEFKAKGVHVALGPVVGPLGRTVEGGRNWEGFGADPYIQGKLAAVTVQGLQKNVLANIKHYIANEQETHRLPVGGRLALSSVVDDTTLHEIYLWPFVDAIHAEVASIMCSYNRINSTYGCENDHTLNHLAKSELAFPGFVLSDWTGQRSGLKSAKAGLDIAMPSSPYWDQGQLADAVKNGTLSKIRLSDMVTRLLAGWIKVTGGPGSPFPESGAGLPQNLLAPHKKVNARDPAAKSTILQGAIEGHVLVKNVNNALPLKKPTMISLFGYDALPPRVNTPSANSLSFWAYGFDSVNITLAAAVPILVGTATSLVGSATLGTITCGGGSGANSNAYLSDPYSAILQRAIRDDTAVFNDFQSFAPVVESSSDACLVFINEFATEGVDRSSVADSASDALVKSVASQCKNTIVTIHNAGPRVVDAWIDNENVTAVIFAHLPGQDSGEALVKILYGDVSPSGRLPYTVAKKADDYGFPLKPCNGTSNDPQCYFLEGPYFDYRHFLKYDIAPRYPFGYGLTYSKFSYSGASAKWLSTTLPKTPPNPKTKIPGGIASLFDTLATVTVTVKNTGSVAAAEVAQVYLEWPNQAGIRHLRGFQKQTISPGQSATFTFNLQRRDLSRWNLVTQGWELQSGTYKVHVGSNVRDIAQTVTLHR